MDPILYNYYIDTSSKKKNSYRLLCLLHEMRIVSKKQLSCFFEIGNLCSEDNVKQMLSILKKKQFVDSIRNSEGAYYFLTKKGYDSIGGYYSLPKVPEYNLQHHLQINDYLIKMLKICEGHPHLNAVISERRQVYEAKDFTKKTKGKKYFVADFIFRFRDRELADINWSFEIELTLKTKRRYREGIFPKYIRELKRREEARLIYVTPSPIIKDELWKFKDYFIYENGKEQEKIFDRLHIFTANEFEEEMIRLVKEDRFINW